MEGGSEVCLFFSFFLCFFFSFFFKKKNHSLTNQHKIRRAFKAFTVDIHWPVRSIIERTRNHNTADETTTTEQQAAAVCSGWAVTEVIEAGDNTFLKVCMGRESV